MKKYLMTNIRKPGFWINTLLTGWFLWWIWDTNKSQEIHGSLYDQQAQVLVNALRSEHSQVITFSGTPPSKMSIGKFTGVILWIKEFNHAPDGSNNIIYTDEYHMIFDPQPVQIDTPAGAIGYVMKGDFF